MAKKIYLLNQFSAGISDSNKQGVVGSFDWARSIDIFTEPTTIQLLPKTAKISVNVVTDLIKWMVRASDGLVYGYGSGGCIYSNTAGTITKLRTVGSSSGNGMMYFDEDDYIYYATNSAIGRYGPLASSPAFNDDFFSDDTYDKDQSDTSASGQTYTLPTTIAETALARQSFTPTQDPIKTIQVNIGAKGTGNWTLTLHDELNNSIAAKTIANASLAASGTQKFTFAAVARITLGQDYHFHLTSTVADGTVVTSTTADLETCYFATYFQVLLTNTDFHPMIDFFETFIFGNEDYVGLWDGYSYPINSCAIKLPRGYKARCLAKVGEYVAIGCWRGSITGDEQGMIVFWDGVAMDFNYSIDIPEGPVHALGTNQNRLFFVAGSEGDLFVTADGIQKIHSFPKLTNQTYVDIAPGAMSSWQAMLMVGAAYNSDSTAIEKGVYVYGQKNKNYSEAFIYGYPISTGTRTGTTLKIGSVLGQGQTLHIGWQDNTAYGWDTVTNSSTFFVSGVVETLIFDNNTPYKQKLAEVIRVDHKALAANESVQIAYKLDRASAWTTGDNNTVADTTETRLPINKRFKEIQIQVTMGSWFEIPLLTTPKVTSIALLFNDNEEEDVV